MKTSWSGDHARLVADAAPRVPEGSEREMDRVWATVRSGMTEVTTPRRRRIRRVLAAVVAGAVLVGGTAAAAEIYQARTGTFAVDAEDLELGGPGERLDPAAPDFGETLDEETRDIPFPDAESRAISRRDEVGYGLRDEPGTASVSTGALRWWVARAALCAWSNEYAAATTRGDAAARGRAATMLRGAPTWPAIVELDPDQELNPEPFTYEEDDGELVTIQGFDNTEAGYVPLLADAVKTGDPRQLASVLATWGSCSPELVPDLPRRFPTWTLEGRG